MPTPSKFTKDVCTKVIEAKTIGASHRTAAKVAGITHPTLLRWLERGKDAAPGTRYREFFEAFEEAETALPLRALGVIWREVPDNPTLAWKVVERREPGFAPPMPQAPAPPAGPVVIALSFQSGPGSLALALPEPEVIEGEVVEDEQDLSPDPAPPAPA